MSILASQQAQAWGSIIMWVVIMVVFVYFFMIRPQKKEAKKKEQMMSELAVGDTVLTTSGFYGIVIDVSEDDTVIVEFGSNRNCRIPMQKAAIAAIEKPEEAVEAKETKKIRGVCEMYKPRIFCIQGTDSCLKKCRYVIIE